MRRATSFCFLLYVSARLCTSLLVIIVVLVVVIVVVVVASRVPHYVGHNGSSEGDISSGVGSGDHSFSDSKAALSMPVTSFVGLTVISSATLLDLMSVRPFSSLASCSVLPLGFEARACCSFSSAFRQLLRQIFPSEIFSMIRHPELFQLYPL
jgi:hypothetical protein